MEKRELFIQGENYLVYNLRGGLYLVEITEDLNAEHRVSNLMAAMEKTQQKIYQLTRDCDPPNRVVFLNAVPIDHRGNTVALLLFTKGG